VAVFVGSGEKLEVYRVKVGLPTERHAHKTTRTLAGSRSRTVQAREGEEEGEGEELEREEEERGGPWTKLEKLRNSSQDIYGRFFRNAGSIYIRLASGPRPENSLFRPIKLKNNHVGQSRKKFE
jgi:hypothetical protein